MSAPRISVGAGEGRTLNQPSEEGLAGEVGVVLLEMLLAGCGEFDGGKLESTLLEAGDDRAN
jgi:hypothetical protein